MNNFLVLCIAAVGIAFLVFLYTDYYHRAALFEWTITYLGSIWLGTFAGYIRYVRFQIAKSQTDRLSQIPRGGRCRQGRRRSRTAASISAVLDLLHLIPNIPNRKTLALALLCTDYLVLHSR